MAMKTQLGIWRDKSPIRLTRFFGLFVACGVLFANLPCVHAELLSYDNGAYGTALDVGMNAAVKFTNSYTGFKMKIESVSVYGNRKTTGDLDVCLWLDAGGGTPGSIPLASLSGEYLKVKGWQVFDFSSFGIEINPGENIFAGFYEAENDSEDTDANAPCDTNATISGRNWYQIDGGAWQQGSPLATTSVGNLMVRLEGSPVPEPGLLALLAMGIVGCATMAWRRR
jgi:hypothetical protein